MNNSACTSSTTILLPLKPLLLSLTIASLTACGGGGSEQTSPTPAAPTTPTTPPPVAEETGVQVSVNFDLIHQVGDQQQFDRQKFITIHASHTENDWYSVGENVSDDLITEFVENYDVYFGRDTGGMAWQLGLLPESPTQSGWVDAEAATSNGSDVRWSYSNNQSERAITTRRHQHRNQQMVVAAQQRPYFPDGTLTRQGWAFSQADSDSEPFGSATGDYMARYISQYFANSPSDQRSDGQIKPKYVEVMNEPIWELVEYGEPPATVEQVFAFHNHVAEAIRSTEINGQTPNAEVLIGGYTAAFPDFDKYNFQQWLDRDKLFIDVAGENMDFLSIHLYDFPIFQGKKQLRSGSNLEATLDLLDSYSQQALGKSMPLMISEYGAQIHDLFNQPWSSARDWHILKGINSQLMQFLERPDLIELAIPFIVVKAEWGRISDTVPYYHRLMRQQHEQPEQTGELWEYTELVKFYQLWSQVKGTRLESGSSDQDLQIDAYLDVEGNTAYLIVNNLEDQATELNLQLFDLDLSQVNQATSKHLYLDDQQVVLEEQPTDLTTAFTLNADATVIFELSLDKANTPTHLAQETKYYHDAELIEIAAEQSYHFEFNDLNLDTHGIAMLRLGIAREHGLSLQPTVILNGTTLEVPQDYRGYDQFHQGQGRDNFYGVIEIPVDFALLETNNSVSVTFAEQGGHLASQALQVITANAEFKR